MMWQPIHLRILAWSATALQLALLISAASVSAREQVTSHPALDYAGSPSADGRFLAFVSEQNGNADIWLKSLATGVFSPPRPLTTYPGKDTSPALNSNGSSLLYVSYRSDPRGDIFLLDIPSGKETRLTDETTGDTAPAWGSGDTIYFLREDVRTGTRGIVRMSLLTRQSEPVMDGVLSFAVGPSGTIAYSDGRKLFILNLSSQNQPLLLTSGAFVDAWPSFVDANTVVFCRYQEDTNHDGTVDANDESSLYLVKWDMSTGQRTALYRLTAGQEFHLYPAAAEAYIYYSDLKRQDIFRLHLPDFLQDYSDISRARELAAIQLDRGDTQAALATLTNISVNLVPQLPFPEQSAFDLALTDLLREAGRYAAAKDILARYASAQGMPGVLYHLSSSVIDLEEHAPFLSPGEMKKTVDRLTKQLLAAASAEGQDDRIRAAAFLEAGRLHLLADDSVTALTFLTRVNDTTDKEIRAKGLFARAQAYRRLGEEDKLLQVFIDVMTAFGEQSFWGRRAVARAVAIAEQPEDFRKAIASLTELADRYHTLPYLAASALLRAADRYNERGETARTIVVLDRIIKEFPDQTTLAADAYRKKGAVLAAAERYEEAATAYGAAADRTGRSREESEYARNLMVLQFVQNAIRKRELGEVRIAAKHLRGMIDTYPDSIEAHRGYIETKVLLKETEEVRQFYEDLTSKAPDRSSYRYGLGLALSYSTPPDIERVIQVIEAATETNPRVPYFHQTLGWAYEQAERMGKAGALEHAEHEYRIALELNDNFLFPEVEQNLLLNLGNTYMRLGNYHEAHRYYARRSQTRPSGKDVLRELLYRKNYGEACFKTGRTEESITQYGHALTLVPKDKDDLKAEILERIGLSQQDAGQYSQAVEYFSEALKLNLQMGTTANLSRLRRNIGINLYNMSTASSAFSRGTLRRALKSQLDSLEALQQVGVAQQQEGPGFLHMHIALGTTSSGAASGFDRRGEEKLMFTYIARTYEELSEPAQARDFYLKKLGLIATDGTGSQAVTAQTEEAVVLNRLGVLSHVLGQTGDGIAYLEQSLARTRELGLSYGTQVNLYNLSRLALERRLAGSDVNPSLIPTLVGGLREHLHQTKPDRQTLYLLANVSCLLAEIDYMDTAPGRSAEDSTKDLYLVYQARQDAASFLRMALSLVETDGLLPAEEAAHARLLLMLNLFDLAQEAGKTAVQAQLKAEVAKLLNERYSTDAWLPPLLEAERTVHTNTREPLLRQSMERLLALPPQVLSRPIGQGTLPLHDRLSTLMTDLLVEQGHIEQAFAISEQIAMRKVAVQLYDQFGTDFFLTGLGDYAAEIGTLVQHMQHAIKGGPPHELARLSTNFRDLIMALQEEHPWSVSYFHQYEPAPQLLSAVITPSTPYLKVVPGLNGLHMFLHDGQRAQHIHISRSETQPLDVTGVQLPIGQATAIYLSVASDLRPLVAPLLPKAAAIVEVATVYDVLNAYHLRTLFATRVAVAGHLSHEEAHLDPMTPVAYLTGEAEQDKALLAGQHVLVTIGPYQNNGFVVRSELGVRNSVPLASLFEKHRHTAILLDPGVNREVLRVILVPALIRAGFAHVIVATGLQPEERRTFIESFMNHLQRQRTDQAAITASRAARATEHHSASTPIQLFGYAGMGQDQKAAFASSEYKKAVAETVAAYRAARYKDALRRAEDALSLLRFTKAGQDFRKLTDVAVDTAFRIGDYRTAILHQTKLVDDINQAGDERAKPGALYRLGILYSRMEEFEPAIMHLESAAALWRTHDELDRLAESIATLGVVKENMGIYADALVAFGQSFELYRDLGEVQDMAAQHRRIGRIDYLRLGRYERAREGFTAALAIYKTTGDQRLQAETLYEIGLTYEKTGLFNEADQHFIEGRRISEMIQDPVLLATGSLYLANTSWFKGQYQEAFDHLDAATKEAERARDPQLPIMIANTKALLYWTLNDLGKALVYAEQALSTAQQADIKTEMASSHNNLGLMLRDQGQLEASLKQFTLAQSIDEKLNSRWGLGYDHRNIGISLMKLGRHAEARTHLETAEQHSASVNNVDNWVKALLELGNVHRETGGYEAAIGYYQRTYNLSKQHHMKEVLWRAAAGHGAMLRMAGRKEEAAAHYAEAVEVVESMRAALKVEEFRNSFQTKTEDLYRDMITLLIELGRPGEAFNYLERSRSRSFIDLLGNQKLTVKTARDQQELDRVMTLQAQLEASTRELASFTAPPQDLVDRVRKTKAAYEEAFVHLKRTSPQLSSFVAVDPMRQEQVQALLEPGVGLLSYKVTTDKVYIWLVTAADTKFFEVATAAGEVELLIRAYRERVQRLESVSEELRRLSTLLIGPALADLSGLRYLGIIPDGPLHFLSFAALSGPEGALIDTYPLFYSPAASVLKFTFAKRSASKLTKVLAIGNPDLGNYHYQLPLAELEARSIRWDFPDLDVLVGAKATKEWIVDNIEHYGVIHLATHGEFDDINPLLSSLWLASENPSNRRLTVREVFGLNIQADLVTLSACQTGLGKLEAGELIGLNRAFIYAGTHALVSALWRVDDLATSVLMKHFYRNYASMDKAASLRQAQLLVKKEFPHPAYWSGLALVGDYR